MMVWYTYASDCVCAFDQFFYVPMEPFCCLCYIVTAVYHSLHVGEFCSDGNVGKYHPLIQR